MAGERPSLVTYHLQLSRSIPAEGWEGPTECGKICGVIIPGKSRSLTPPIGVIDSLASGLETVATHLPLLLLPLLLDVILWLGPRVSFRPLLVWLGDFVANDPSPTSLLVLLSVLYLGFPFFAHQEMWRPILLAFPQTEQTSFAGVAEAVRSITQSAPDQFLSVSVMPSMVAGRSAGLLPFGYTPPIWQIQTPVEVLVLRLLLFLVGLVLLIVYLTLIAQQIREGHNGPGWVARRASVVLIQVVAVLILLLVVAVGAALMLSMALSAIVLLGSMLGGNQLAEALASITLLLLFLMASWFILLTAFTVHGMLMNDRGVFAAMWDSLRVVQWNMSSTFGLLLVMFIVAMAAYYVRGWLDPGSLLMPIGMVGHAFISTGLLAATFVFFKDRYRYWRELRDQLLAELERRRVQQNMKQS